MKRGVARKRRKKAKKAQFPCRAWLGGSIIPAGSFFGLSGPIATERENGFVVSQIFLICGR